MAATTGAPASVIAGVIASTLAILLLWSLVSKSFLWSRGEHARLLQLVPGPESLRSVGLGAVLIAEASIAAILFLRPQEGMGLATLLFGAFTARVWTIRGGEGCDCFGGALEFGGGSLALVARNAVLVAIGAAGWVLSRSAGVETGTFVVATSGFVLFVLWALEQYVQPRPRDRFSLRGA